MRSFVINFITCQYFIIKIHTNDKSEILSNNLKNRKHFPQAAERVLLKITTHIPARQSMPAGPKFVWLMFNKLPMLYFIAFRSHSITVKYLECKQKIVF